MGWPFSVLVGRGELNIYPNILIYYLKFCLHIAFGMLFGIQILTPLWGFESAAHFKSTGWVAATYMTVDGLD